MMTLLFSIASKPSRVSIRLQVSMFSFHFSLAGYVRTCPIWLNRHLRLRAMIQVGHSFPWSINLDILDSKYRPRVTSILAFLCSDVFHGPRHGRRDRLLYASVFIRISAQHR
ncbi:hypothetical protein NEOLEDRAFT_714017 [Neolentinus lepideus HHB14362 ss-1]|uniref:Uncharacterized protein n=1 Tax=Neolentinus lepideus HHB14362 ss-1 TaxID=1314782 RepID=A0A165Q4M1_9AGAM|nr:hypothetical protein NEOLEDRAFT_714017 [Neolentinus lepideus HHB14362 ss-1]